MNKIKKYIDCYIPTETCNFRCHYCYIVNYGKFNQKLFKLTHSPEEIRKCLSVERLGGECLINLCAGGETLLSEDIIPLAKALLEEGHYVMIVTNGSLTNRFEEIKQFPSELLKHLFFKFSFHYLELKRLNLLNTYFNNINLMKNVGVSYTVEITPNDELIPYIDEIKKISMEKLGALPHLTIGRKDTDDIPILTNLNEKEYYKTWSTFNSDLFNYKKAIFGRKVKEFCYAGKWSYYLNIETGSLKQCYLGCEIDNIYKNPEKKLNELPVGCNCQEPHCYNAHSWLALGDVPELSNDVTYAKLRNRKCLDGSEWLNEDMKSFMNTKLYETNNELNEKQKKQVNKKVHKIYLENKIRNKIKKLLKK